MEPSTREPTSSSENARALKMAAQTPRLDHSANRLKIVFQLPNRSGRSLQGAPVLAIQTTALTKFLSPRAEGRPRPLGRTPTTTFHGLSPNSCRRMKRVDQTLILDTTRYLSFCHLGSKCPSTSLRVSGE